MNYPFTMFDLTRSLAGDFIKKQEYIWQALAGLKEFISTVGESLDSDYVRYCPNVWIHRTADISPSAFIGEYSIIGARTEVRTGAFIRGSAMIGNGCVVGNSTEIKNSVLFDGVQVPHFNYVGDSILGYRVHFGAGAITSNVKSDKSEICTYVDGKKISTGLKKFGAAVGDGVEIGCNCVLNPGTLIGEYTRIYPLNSVRGCISGNCIYKSPTEIISIKRKSAP